MSHFRIFRVIRYVNVEDSTTKYVCSLCTSVLPRSYGSGRTKVETLSLIKVT